MSDGAKPVRTEGRIEAPEERRPLPAPARRRRRWVVAVVVLVVALIAVAVWRSRSQPRPAAGPAAPGGAPTGAARGGDAAARPVSVAAAQVARRDVPIHLTGLGNVVANRTVTVKTQVDGRLQDVLFREGQAVRRGDVLAQIDPRPFQAQLHQAEGALKRDLAQLAGARRNFERFKQLAEQKLIPQQQADDQEALVGQLDGAVQIDRATIETAKLNLDYARITSPVDGVTGIRAVDPGNVVHATDQNGIVLVTQLDPIAVLFTLPQDQLTAVATELARGPLSVDIYGRDGAALLGTGKVELIDNQINQATSTIRLKAIIPNPRRLLWPNQFVNARLLLTTRQGALVVPTTALQRGPSGTLVYVINDDGTVAPRPVAVDATEGDLAIVAKGLQQGERVVTDGQNQLRPGSKVNVREPGQRGAPGGGQGQGGGGQGQGRGQGAGQGQGPTGAPGPGTGPQPTGAGAGR